MQLLTNKTTNSKIGTEIQFIPELCNFLDSNIMTKLIIRIEYQKRDATNLTSISSLIRYRIKRTSEH